MKINENQWKSVKIHWFSSILDDDVSRVGELSDLWRSPRGHRGHSGRHILARNVVNVVQTDPRDHRSLQTRFFENLPHLSHMVHDMTLSRDGNSHSRPDVNHWNSLLFRSKMMSNDTYLLWEVYKVISNRFMREYYDQTVSRVISLIQSRIWPNPWNPCPAGPLVWGADKFV